jgi:hypothetical protein
MPPSLVANTEVTVRQDEASRVETSKSPPETEKSHAEPSDSSDLAARRSERRARFTSAGTGVSERLADRSSVSQTPRNVKPALTGKV